MSSDRYHHGDLRRALLDAAEAQVIDQGAEKVSLRGIARSAGVSTAAPYHHFDSRESLLAGVAARGFRGLRGAMEEGAAAPDDEGPLARLRAAGAAYVSFALENPELYRLMFSGLLSDRARFPELKSEADTAFTVLTRLLDRSARPDSTPDDSLHPVALAAWSTVHGVASLVIEGLLTEELENLGSEGLTREITAVLGRGLKAYAGES